MVALTAPGNPMRQSLVLSLLQMEENGQEGVVVFSETTPLEPGFRPSLSVLTAADHPLHGREMTQSWGDFI